MLDLVLPDGDGFAVLELMRARRELLDVPVIVVTIPYPGASPDTAERELVKEIGEDAADVLLQGLARYAGTVESIRVAGASGVGFAGNNACMSSRIRS